MSLNSGSSVKNEETVLLLTGAINVLQLKMPFLTISNLEERLSQYLFSIGYAIDNYYSIKNIVFCENTNYAHDYTSLIEKAKEKGKELEILTFKGNYPIIQQKGKGHGEGEIIEYALKNSELLNNCQSFYKLTGRLVIENLDQIVDSTKEENGFIFHPKEIYLMETDQSGTDHLETFFFKVSKKFYANRLIDAYKEVDEIKHIYIEHLFYERLKKLNIRAFKYPLHIIGNSGTSGRPYLESQNAIRREQIFCAMGAHHLKKNGFEKVLTTLLGWLLKSRKKFKKAKLFRKST